MILRDQECKTVKITSKKFEKERKKFLTNEIRCDKINELKPLGFNDWRISTALVTGITAKEAVVSTLSVLLGTNAAHVAASLGTLFTVRSAISFLVFTLLYTPCVAAIAAIKREMDSTLKTIGIIILQCSVAWLAAWLVYLAFGVLH